MKTWVTSLLVFAVCCAALPASAESVFYIGVDNGNNSDFDAEGYADDDYYWENGDYTGLGLGTTAGVWTGGQEVWRDDTATTMGFERALTTTDYFTNIFFQLDATEVAGTFTLVADMVQPSGTHDVTYMMNGVVVDTETAIGTKYVTVTFTGAEVNAVVGSNVITAQKTNSGGWIQFDYVSLEVVPEPSTVAMLVGLGVVGLLGYLRRRRG